MFLLLTILSVAVAANDQNWKECSPGSETVAESSTTEDLEKLAKKAVRVNVAITFIKSFVPETHEIKCSGVLITRKHVLTAADCFTWNNETSTYKVRVGNTNFRDGKAYSIKSIKIHGGYKPGDYHDDIAILTLTNSVPHASVLCIPHRAMAKKKLDNLGATAGDWGSGETQSNLHLTTMRVISNKKCNRTHTKTVTGPSGDEVTSTFLHYSPQGITSDMLGAELFDTERTCSMTSGGPLMFLKDGRWYAIGIKISFSIGCQSDYPIPFTRVASYKDWILKNIKSG